MIFKLSSSMKVIFNSKPSWTPFDHMTVAIRNCFILVLVKLHNSRHDRYLTDMRPACDQSVVRILMSGIVYPYRTKLGNHMFGSKQYYLKWLMT